MVRASNELVYEFDSKFRTDKRQIMVVPLIKLISYRTKSQMKLTPVENQSPSGVGVTRDLIASTIDTAVDAAEDLPHF